MPMVLEQQLQDADSAQLLGISGSVVSVQGMSLRVRHLPLPLGSVVELDGAGELPVRGEVVGFDDSDAVVMLYDHVDGVRPGCPVRARTDAGRVQVGHGMLGRVVDAMGQPLDGRGPIRDLSWRPLSGDGVSPMERDIIRDPLPTGIRSIDGLLTIGRGQRLGIFSGPGVGKSTLLASITRATAADAVVIALVGERGREAAEFVEQTLGDEGLARAIVVVSTGDESPLRRARATYLAMAAAEALRDDGAHVLFCMDSLTRHAHALRQIGLASGEHPATRGYPPSVFAQLPRLIERAGTVRGGGSITGLYTVLVEGDDMAEPVTDAALGVLDGHLVLSKDLASRGHYPAIDPLQSVSRLADQVSDPNHVAARREIVSMLAAWSDVEDLVSIGAYAGGSNPRSDAAIELQPAIMDYLAQDLDDRSAYPETCRALVQMATHSVQTRQRVNGGGAG
tara:strand:- start:6462 stop:7817 length:1356 start_codon:yes stop_codon:yes gene_type:complete